MPAPSYVLLVPALLGVALGSALAPTLRAQPARRGLEAPAPDPSPLSDEFDGGPAGADGAPAGWRWLHAADGWPSHVRRAGLGLGVPGALRIEPATSGWYADFRGPFLYREVEGDFLVRARVRAAGTATDVPAVPWSLGGLMVRSPRPVTPATWEARGENWLFVTTGAAAAGGRPVFETKTTVNGGSALRLHPARAGWVELGLARVGPSFVALARYDGEPWRVLDRFFRPDLPRTVQVGLNAYTDWDSAERLRADPLRFNTAVLAGGRPDLVLDVDHVRFAPVRVAGDPAALAAHDVPNDAVLRQLGLDSPDRPATASAEPPPAAALTPALRRSALDSAADALAARYVDAAGGHRLADSLRAWARRDRFAALADPTAFADALGGALQAVVPDLHLYARYEPGVERRGAEVDRVAAAPGAGGAVRRVGRVDPRDSLAVARTNFGFARVERLEGNVGYVRLERFVPPDWSQPTADAALAFLRHTDAVVLDVRGVPGGSPLLVAHLLSHFYAGPRTLMHASRTRDGVADSLWTAPELARRGLAGKPLYVVADGRSMSAAEMIAYYGRRLGVAVVVGERTAGAGNGGWMQPLGAGLALFVPERRVLTGPGWERTGVAPDVEAAPDEAVERARALAVGRLATPVPAR